MLRLIELHEEVKWQRETEGIHAAVFRNHPELRDAGEAAEFHARTASNIERTIEGRLAEGSIGWNPPLRYGVPDSERIYGCACGWNRSGKCLRCDALAVPFWREGDLAGPEYQEHGL